MTATPLIRFDKRRAVGIEYTQDERRSQHNILVARVVRPSSVLGRFKPPSVDGLHLPPPLRPRLRHDCLGVMLWPPTERACLVFGAVPSLQERSRCGRTDHLAFPAIGEQDWIELRADPCVYGG